MRYYVKHETSYKYQQPTVLSYNEAWMFPRQLDYQNVLSTDLKLVPNPSEIQYREDFFGNKVAYFSVRESHEEFIASVESIIDREPPLIERVENISLIGWSNVVAQFQRFDPLRIPEQMFILPSPVVPTLDELRHYAQPSFDRFASLFEAVSDLNSRIYQDFDYDPEFTTVATPLIEVAKAKKGVCQDFAHLAIGCLRAMRLPARYVSGYIETYSPEGSADLVGTAASHAWFSVFIPGMGWTDFDPTNNQLVKSQHITIGWGRDYQDIPPLKGVIFNSSQHELNVSVEVKRL